MGNGGGGGLQHTQRGDRQGECMHVCQIDSSLSLLTRCVFKCRYEGEFAGGFAHGLGIFSKADGQVYRGEFMYGKKHGYVINLTAGSMSCAVRSLTQSLARQWCLCLGLGNHS